jgi:hypothetical protein
MEEETGHLGARANKKDLTANANATASPNHIESGYRGPSEGENQDRIFKKWMCMG